jgi:diadenosine tetraphosphate (Ap4A) HIT family hydrolase
MFVLDAKLEEDTFLISEMEVSKLLLINDSNYPWLVLVPRRENITELTDLAFDEFYSRISNVIN